DPQRVLERLEHRHEASPALPSRTSQVPPAPSTFSRAVALKAWTRTVSFFESSPRPRSFTGMRRFANPAARSDSGVTSAPASKRPSRSATLTGCVRVRNGSNGIDIFLFGPRSLRLRMWIGFWPPSYAGLRFDPDRAPAPLWPRPDV